MFENPYNTTYSADEVAEAEARLRSWPSLEETEASLTEAMQRIADAVTAINPQVQWEWFGHREESGCPGVFRGLGGWTVRSRFLLADVIPIPDETWSQTLEAARNVATEFGLGELYVQADSPGNHSVFFRSSDGTKISLGSRVSSLVVADIGCRLKAPLPGS